MGFLPLETGVLHSWLHCALCAHCLCHVARSSNPASTLRRLSPAALPWQEAYEGPEASCDVTGLPPNSQLVFCVKVRSCTACWLAGYGTCSCRRAFEAGTWDAVARYHISPACLPTCAQALYDDKHFLWSEPLMVTTAAACRPRARQK